jgi:hypothetical protein
MSIRRYCLLLLLLIPQITFALDLATEDLFFDVKSVTLSMTDQAEDGCLPNPQSVSARMAAALRRNAFIIADPENSPPSTPDVEVTALGYAVNEDCVVVFTVALSREFNADVPHAENLPAADQQTPITVKLPVYRSLLSGDRQGMQTQIEHEVDRAGDELGVAVDAAKSSVKANWPQLWEAYSAVQED